MSIEKKSFGFTEEKEAELYALKNENGMEVTVTNYGANIVESLQTLSSVTKRRRSMRQEKVISEQQSEGMPTE